MVKIVATGFGTTALRSGQILHFDDAEKKAKAPDKRKLEAEIEDIEDAKRIVDLGWAKFADDADAEAATEPSNGAIQAAAVVLEGTPVVDGDSAAEPKPAAARKTAQRKPAARKPAAKAKATSPAPAAAPAPTPLPAGEQPGGQSDAGDPEAGPAA